MKVDDFQLFMMLCQSLTPDKTKPLLGDLDLTKFKPYSVGETENVVLANGEVDENGNPIVINTIIYEILVTWAWAAVDKIWAALHKGAKWFFSFFHFSISFKIITQKISTFKHCFLINIHLI